MHNQMYMMPGHGYLPANPGFNPHDTRLWGGFGWGFRPWGWGFPYGGFGFGMPFGFGFPFFL